MRCPYCGNEDTQVKDSRPSEEGGAIRRRRFCNQCDARFTTVERVHMRQLYVLKKNGNKVPYNREKLYKSLDIALRKRPVSIEDIDKLVNQTSFHFENLGEAEIKSDDIGVFVTDRLLKLDKIAYIRYVSVYRDFKDTSDFENVVLRMKQADAEQMG
jgi:transcriptional repressor NrdR